MTRDYFIFDNIDSRLYNAWITGEAVFSAPKRKASLHEIPGKNGALPAEEGVTFEEIEHDYPGFIARDYRENLRSLRSALLSKQGKCKLWDSYNPDEYYLAVCYEGIKSKAAPRAVAGEVEFKFQRDPRRFLLSGEDFQEYTEPREIYNPTEYSARPQIRVYGYGTLSFVDQDVEIAQHALAYVDIDCENEDCYYLSQNMNYLVTLSNGFPQLRPEWTPFTFSGNITKVLIRPNWWRL